MHKTVAASFCNHTRSCTHHVTTQVLIFVDDMYSGAVHHYHGGVRPDIKDRVVTPDTNCAWIAHVNLNNKSKVLFNHDEYDYSNAR